MTIHLQYVPEQFRHLLPLAEAWGIADDGARADKLCAATAQEREALQAAVLPLADALYRDWLGDTAQLQTAAKATYLAFTALVLAAEEA